MINMASSSQSLMFTVRRCQPELVAPATLTPHELKPLSDIDDQEGLRFHVPMIQIYRNEPSMAEKDPVEVIRKALAQTLVFYYPFAGRLREGPGRKLMVDCNGEGVMFIEADADITLDEFGDALQPPFPCLQELLYDVPGTQEITNTPLLLVQVTRLKCGGFVLAFHMNHAMSDGAGISQFLNALAEMAQGAPEPSVQPLWRRELLMARNPPRITCNHREYDQILDPKEDTIINTSYENDMVLRSFFFGPTEITALRRLVPHHLQHYTTFDIITACMWRCRTKAMQIDADKDVRMMVIVNARARFNPPLPVGYYGNAIAWPAAVTTAGKLCENPFGYAVELINKVKREVTEEYMHSVADLMVTKGRCLFTTIRSFFVSDLRHFNFKQIDFGWGKAVYGGVAKGGAGPFPAVIYLLRHKNANGEEGIVIPIWLPAKAMDKFANELDDMLWNQNKNQHMSTKRVDQLVQNHSTVTGRRISVLHSTRDILWFLTLFHHRTVPYSLPSSHHRTRQPPPRHCHRASAPAPPHHRATAIAPPCLRASTPPPMLHRARATSGNRACSNCSPKTHSQGHPWHARNPRWLPLTLPSILLCPCFPLRHGHHRRFPFRHCFPVL